jgi:hypothetical protein
MSEVNWRKAGLCDKVSMLRDTILHKDVKQFGFDTMAPGHLSPV